MIHKDYHRTMLVRCYQLAQASPDTSTQNGAIIVNTEGKEIGSGCNEFTKGINVTPEILMRPLKYAYIEHAERQAIFDATLNGNKTLGATMFCPWSASSDCARAIVQSGIVLLVRHMDAIVKSPKNWAESIKIADHILRAGKVDIVEISGKLGAPAILQNGVLCRP